MTKPEDFAPTVLAPGYGLVLVETATCAACKRTMIHSRIAAVLPAYWKVGREEQLKRGDWREQSGVSNAADEPLCKECAPVAGAYHCALCDQDRAGKPQDSYGDPAEHLCTTCYETVSAKIWNEKSRELDMAHRYDFGC